MVPTGMAGLRVPLVGTTGGPGTELHSFMKRQMVLEKSVVGIRQQLGLLVGMIAAELKGATGGQGGAAGQGEAAPGGQPRTACSNQYYTHPRATSTS